MRSILCMLVVFSSAVAATAAEKVILVSSIIPAAEMAHRTAELPDWDATLHHYVVGTAPAHASCRRSVESEKALTPSEKRHHPCDGV